MFQPDAKGPRPEPLREKENDGKDPDAYDKMNALSLVRLEASDPWRWMAATYTGTFTM